MPSGQTQRELTAGAAGPWGEARGRCPWADPKCRPYRGRDGDPEVALRVGTAGRAICRDLLG
jgi:hypothetical protein